MKAWIAWVTVFIAGVGGLWMVKAHFFNREQSARYEASPACAEGRPAPDCRSKETATVSEKTVKRSGRNRTYWIEFRVAGGNAPAMVSSEQYDAALKDESLDIERWNGRITRIYRNGRLEEIEQTPKRDRSGLVIGIVGIFIALCMLWMILKLRRAGKLAKAARLA